jgi:hypothetical protein
MTVGRWVLCLAFQDLNDLAPPSSLGRIDQEIGHRDDLVGTTPHPNAHSCPT